MGEVYTIHLVPPLAHAKHYSGWAKEGRSRARSTDHALGRGARMLAAQMKAGGSWVIAKIEPGTRDLETTRKERGASRRCPVCKAEAAYAAGKLTAEEALKTAGWDRANEHERNLLVRDFGLTEAPAELAARTPKPEPEVIQIRHPKTEVPSVSPEQRAEMDRLADELVAQWRAELDSPKAEAEREMECG
jgi:hypothetical protein